MMRKEQKNRYGLVLAAMLAAAFITACGGQKETQGTVSVQTEAHDDSKIMQMPETAVGMPNPFTDNSTLEEAEKHAGFSIQIPDEIQGVSASAFRNLRQELLEVIYYDQEGQEVARIRKGTGNQDISGDYVNYDEVKAETVNGKSVTMKGQDGTISLAIWNDGEYSYSVSVENAASMDEMTELISGIE